MHTEFLKRILDVNVWREKYAKIVENKKKSCLLKYLASKA